MAPNPNVVPSPAERLAALMAEVARYMRDLRADQAGGGIQHTIHAFYRETRRIVEAFDLGAGLQVRPSVLTFQATLGTGALSGSDNFKMPEGEDFVLLEMRGLYAALAPATDYTTTRYNYADTAGRVLMKTNNCKLDFRLKDQASRVFTERNNIVLSSITPEAGGQTMHFTRDGAPMFIIPHGTVPEATMTLQDSTADVVGGNANYGVSLYGVYVSRPTRQG